MKWTPLSPIALEDWFSRKVKTAAGGLNEKIEGVLQARTQLETTLAKLGAEDVANAEMGNVVGYAAFDVTRLEILQRELLLRRELSLFWGEYFTEAARAHTKAVQDHQKAEELVTGELVEMGYHPFQLGESDPSMLTPGMIHRHPRVRAAHDRVESLRSKASDRTRAAENDAAMGVITRELEKARQQGLPA